MARKILFALLLLLPVLIFGETPYRINLAGSGYTAQLRGKAGTRTAGLVVTGTYKSALKSHEFKVAVTGPYDLYVDATGGTSYIKDSNWSGTSGKDIYGTDLTTIMAKLDPSLLQWLSTAYKAQSVGTTALADGGVTSAKILDYTITARDLSWALYQMIDTTQVDSIVNHPDDETIKVNGSNELYVAPYNTYTAITVGDTAPNFSAGMYWKTANTAATEITRIRGMQDGGHSWVWFGDDSTTVASNDSIRWEGDISMMFLSGDKAFFEQHDGVVYGTVIRLQ